MKPTSLGSANVPEELAPEPMASARSTHERPLPLPPLPSSYGQDLIVLQVRDPRWLHAYWELTPPRVAAGRAELGAGAAGAVWILRVYDEECSRSFDIGLAPLAADWAFEVEPDRTWVVEIGLKAASGRFVPLARSNRVRTPPVGPSGRIDEEWPPIESLPAGWPSPSSAEPSLRGSP